MKIEKIKNNNIGCNAAECWVEVLNKINELIDAVNKGDDKESQPVILPCPFCGSVGKLSQLIPVDSWIVYCVNDDCIAEGISGGYASERSAIIAWNNRYV